MSKFEKITEVENARYNCKTLGDLLNNFQVKLTYFFNDKKRSHNVAPQDYNIIYTDYLIIKYYDNPLHVFIGFAEDEHSPIRKQACILDIIHLKIYDIQYLSDELVLDEYNIEGELLNTVHERKNLELHDLIEKYAMRDYHCYTIGELIDNFNIDLELTQNLRSHIIIEKQEQHCDYTSGFNLLFNDYSILEFDDTKLYVFESIFDYDTLRLDTNPPVYYIDFERQLLYMETKGMVGTCILQFNEKNEIIQDAHAWDIDIKSFIRLVS